MEWSIDPASFNHFKEQLYEAEHLRSNKDSFATLMDKKSLSAIASQLAHQTFAQLNDYRKSRNLPLCTWDLSLQMGATIRGQEVLRKPDTVRPDGTQGLDTPYSLGYPKNQKETTFESIGSFSSNSLKWIIQNTPAQILAMFQQGNEEFLKGDTSEEQAVGIYIEETPEAYYVGFDYLCGKKKIVKEKPVSRQRLIRLYNRASDLEALDYTPDSWNTLMLVKAEAKKVYRQKNKTQKEIDAISEKLAKAIEDLIAAN